MSRQILQKMNKDINHLYINQKNEIKDLCQIQKTTVSIIKPTILFVVVSLILCFQIYQVQISYTPTPINTEIKTSQPETETNNAIIAEDKQEKSISYKETETIEKTSNQSNHPSYMGIYALLGMDIFIIIYIFIKKSNKT